MDEEYTSIIKNINWELIKLPKGKKPIRVKWVYKINYNLDGQVRRYKFRLVVKVYSQKE